MLLRLILGIQVIIVVAAYPGQPQRLCGEYLNTKLHEVCKGVFNHMKRAGAFHLLNLKQN